MQLMQHNIYCERTPYPSWAPGPYPPSPSHATSGERTVLLLTANTLSEPSKGFRAQYALSGTPHHTHVGYTFCVIVQSSFAVGVPHTAYCSGNHPEGPFPGCLATPTSGSGYRALASNA